MNARLYEEIYRPQFHFTAQRNWLNDPNGLVFYKGEYHLFFQHNPTSVDWGDMTWGHAVSPDMLHWEQLPHAIEPDELGTIFSGSAVVDWNDTAGFQTGGEKPLVAIYTSAGDQAPEPKPFTQSIAFSNDRGRTFQKFERNPVLGHIAGSNRDPKVFWHAPSAKWVMALYLDAFAYAIFGSKNLKEWERLCDVAIPGTSECPDLFELPVDGDPRNTRWVFWGANARYLLGSFDGREFKVESGPHSSEHGSHFYAAQSWSDVPESDGRRLQIGWMQGGTYPDMPFNQQMSIPCELTLRTFTEGIRLCRRPVREIERLRAEHSNWADAALKPGDNPLAALSGDLFEIRAEIEMGDAEEVGFVLRGSTVAFNGKEGILSGFGKAALLDASDGVVWLHVLLDRTSIEVFANGGQVAQSFCFLPPAEDKSLAAYAAGGTARIRSLDVWRLESIWPQ